MNEKLKALLDSLGAVSEITFAQFKSFRDAGFTTDQAMQLTGVFLSTMLKTSMETGSKNDA